MHIGRVRRRIIMSGDDDGKNGREKTAERHARSKNKDVRRTRPVRLGGDPGRWAANRLGFNLCNILYFTTVLNGRRSMVVGTIYFSFMFIFFVRQDDYIFSGGGGGRDMWTTIFVLFPTDMISKRTIRSFHNVFIEDR